jgi:hypothetical protein
MADNTQYQDNKGDLDVPEQPLPEDHDTPAAPPESKDDLAEPKDYPTLDTSVDEGEKYDAGQAAASGYDTQHVDDDEERAERIG